LRGESKNVTPILYFAVLTITKTAAFFPTLIKG